MCALGLDVAPERTFCSNACGTALFPHAREWWGHRMDKLTGMAVFAQVVDAESFTRAAVRLGMSKSAVSKAVSALEDRLGARLLNRTTRRLSLTEVGRAFYERCARIVAEAEEAELAVTRLQEGPRGTLRVNAPLSFGILHLGPALAAFMCRHPDLAVEMELADRFVDVIEEGYDVVVRIAESLPDSSLIARRITDNEMIICASPDYWARRGRPRVPEELTQHDMMTVGWFEDRHGRLREPAVHKVQRLGDAQQAGWTLSHFRPDSYGTRLATHFGAGAP
jgi:DNA-binding transcriptional LysR family regulator